MIQRISLDFNSILKVYGSILVRRAFPRRSRPSPRRSRAFPRRSKSAQEPTENGKRKGFSSEIGCRTEVKGFQDFHFRRVVLGDMPMFIVVAVQSVEGNVQNQRFKGTFKGNIITVFERVPWLLPTPLAPQILSRKCNCNAILMAVKSPIVGVGGMRRSL